MGWKPSLGGLPWFVGQLSKKSLAVPAFTVQNGHASCSVTHPAPTVDWAEIGRIRALYVQVTANSAKKATSDRPTLLALIGNDFPFKRVLSNLNRRAGLARLTVDVKQ
jgi:hypothetical protein